MNTDITDDIASMATEPIAQEDNEEPQMHAIDERNYDFDGNIGNFDEFIAANRSVEGLTLNAIPQETECQLIVTTFLMRITQLTELRQLELLFLTKEDVMEYSIGNYLRDIGFKCPKLQRFRLKLCSQTPKLNVDVLNAVPSMPRLTRLDLKLVIPQTERRVTTDPQTECRVVTDWRAFDSVRDWPKGLTHLSLYLWLYWPQLFREMASNLRKLKSLHISDAKKYMNGNWLTSISRLGDLKELVIRSRDVYAVNRTSLKQLARNASPKLRSIIYTNHHNHNRDPYYHWLHLDVKKINKLRQTDEFSDDD